MADGEKEKKSGKGKLIIILLLLLALVGGGGFAAWKFILPGIMEEKADEAGGSAENAGGKENGSGGAGDAKGAPAISTSTVTLPTFLVNLQDPVGRRFIKLNMDVEVTGPGAEDEIKRSMPRIKDSINMLLSSKSYADLASIENKILLKNEIVERINQILGGSRVKQVYFSDLIIQ